MCTTWEPACLLINGKCRIEAKYSPPVSSFTFFLPHQLFYCYPTWTCNRNSHSNRP
jgi:hypothetical protein